MFHVVHVLKYFAEKKEAQKFINPELAQMKLNYAKSMYAICTENSRSYSKFSFLKRYLPETVRLRKPGSHVGRSFFTAAMGSCETVLRLVDTVVFSPSSCKILISRSDDSMQRQLCKLSLTKRYKITLFPADITPNWPEEPQPKIAYAT